MRKCTRVYVSRAIIRLVRTRLHCLLYQGLFSRMHSLRNPKIFKNDKRRVKHGLRNLITELKSLSDFLFIYLYIYFISVCTKTLQTTVPEISERTVMKHFQSNAETNILADVPMPIIYPSTCKHVDQITDKPSGNALQ